MNAGSGVLLTRSCTTGWGDWVHGELWALNDALLRRELGVGRTMSHGFWPTVRTSARPTREFGQDEISRILRASNRNLLVSRGEITSAHLRRGALNSRLDLETGGGGASLMWFRHDRAFDYLAELLDDWLGDRLSIS